MPLNENIRNARKKKGLKQVELADMAGISVNSVRLYESGKIEPQVSTLARIADVLGVSVGELLADNWGSGPDTPQLSNEEYDIESLRRITQRFNFELEFRCGDYYLTKDSSSYRLTQDQLYELINNSFCYVGFLCDKLFTELEAITEQKPQD